MGLVNGAGRQTGRSQPELLAQPERLAVAFPRLLRAVGVKVPADASLVYAEALSTVGLSHRRPVYWAGRATLITRPEDVVAYDRAFEAFFLGRARPMWVTDRSSTAMEVGTGAGDDEPGAPNAGRFDKGGDGVVFSLRYSPVEVLRAKDFALCTAEERAEVQRLLAALRFGGPMRRSRRYRRAGRGRAQLDLPRTVRRAMRAGGEPVPRAWRAPGLRPRRIVVLCDVSGSMEPYARLLMRFLHVVASGRANVEAFALSTRLTRLTKEMSLHDPDAALARAARAVPDWSSGTRLGTTLREFNDQWGTRGLARGAVVVVFSDGWDRGDPGLLANEMARLSRVAFKIVWANPVKASPGYAPLARGMAAALPYVDDFVEGHSLASLEALAGLVTGGGRPPRY